MALAAASAARTGSRRAAAWLAGLLLLVAATLAHGADSYSFAVVPQFEQRKQFAIWKPIVDELTRRSGVKLDLVATLTVQEFEREMASGTFDFVYVNPYLLLRQAGRQGYVPLLHDKEPLRGILVVRRDSPVQSVAELDGKTLAIPSFNALGASLMIRADLDRMFKVRMKLLNAKTHSSVYLHVANGLVAAGGGVEKTLQEQDKSIRDLLRVIYTTREMPSHPVAAHPRVPVAVRDKVQRAFFDLAVTEHGRRLLDEVPMKEALPTSLKDYMPMRDWGLESYWVD